MTLRPINGRDFDEIANIQSELKCDYETAVATWNERFNKPSPKGDPVTPEHRNLATFNQSGRDR
jgi:hypothetical protein